MSVHRYLLVLVVVGLGCLLDYSRRLSVPVPVVAGGGEAGVPPVGVMVERKLPPELAAAGRLFGGDGQRAEAKAKVTELVTQGNRRVRMLGLFVSDAVAVAVMVVLDGSGGEVERRGVREGEELQGYRVVGIGGDRVELEREGKRVELLIFKGPVALGSG